MKLFKESERDCGIGKHTSLLLSTLFSRCFTSLMCIVTEVDKKRVCMERQKNFPGVISVTSNKVSCETKKMFLKSILYMLNTQSHTL